MQRVKEPGARLWYMQQTLVNGWSRNVLLVMIKSGAHRRQGTALTNFEQRLPAPQSDLAQQMLKDPYIFDFLTLEEPFRERELETNLLRQLERFLVELVPGPQSHRRRVRAARRHQADWHPGIRAHSRLAAEPTVRFANSGRDRSRIVRVGPCTDRFAEREKTEGRKGGHEKTTEEETQKMKWSINSKHPNPAIHVMVVLNP